MSASVAALRAAPPTAEARIDSWPGAHDESTGSAATAWLELASREVAYSAGLVACEHVVQPSLVRFLR